MASVGSRWVFQSGMAHCCPVYPRVRPALDLKM